MFKTELTNFLFYHGAISHQLYGQIEIDRPVIKFTTDEMLKRTGHKTIRQMSYQLELCAIMQEVSINS